MTGIDTIMFAGLMVAAVCLVVYGAAFGDPENARARKARWTRR